MIIVSDSQGTTLLVGAAMQGQLVAATLVLHGSEIGMPQAFGFRATQGAWQMGGAYDIDAYSPSSEAPHPVQPVPPLAVVVSPLRSGTTKNILGIVQMHDSTTNAFLPPDQWKQLGAVPFRDVVASSGTNRTTGCNRVRVHARTKRAAFSCAPSFPHNAVSESSLVHNCMLTAIKTARSHVVSTILLGAGFGSKREHGDIVAFVDISDPTNPSLISTTRFVSQQVRRKLSAAGFHLFVRVSDCHHCVEWCCAAYWHADCWRRLVRGRRARHDGIQSGGG
eukprot:COSAG02_NODE_7131_length_3166_cov_1.967069_4_plen_279_part_00